MAREIHSPASLTDTPGHEITPSQKKSERTRPNKGNSQVAGHVSNNAGVEMNTAGDTGALKEVTFSESRHQEYSCRLPCLTENSVK